MVPEAPLAVNRARQESSAITDDRDHLQPSDRVLLIIEDDLVFAQILLTIAHENGFKGVLAFNGDDGLTLARSLNPNAITLDIQLPAVDGWAVLDWLKQDAATRHIPVHIISVVEDQQRGLQQGAIAYLKKPVSREALNAGLKKIAQFIERPVKDLLIIEDDAAQRKSIAELLNAGDVNTVAVGSGQAALGILKARRFDCVVLDLDLPDMHGLELIHKVEAHLGVWSDPVIVYSAKALSADEQADLERIAHTARIKNVGSVAALLEETTLFLHRVETQVPDAQRSVLDQKPRTNGSLTDKTLLIVDDDIRNIFALTSILETYQIEVLHAENGREGIALLQSTPTIDLVLMDIMMPEMDGYETMREIRRLDAFKTLPIIALTAKAMKGDREKCLEAGASDYITKPVAVEQLLALLHTWLANPADRRTNA